MSARIASHSVSQPGNTARTAISLMPSENAMFTLMVLRAARDRLTVNGS